MTTYDDDLRLAHVIADMVDALTTSRFQAADLRVETKPDLTPVSDADKAAEELIRTQLRRTRPRDAVVGEEFEPTGHGSRQWVVDPIDGTKNFVRGVPVWATLLALLDDREPVVGVVSAPALGRRWWAARGTGRVDGPQSVVGPSPARLRRERARGRVPVVLRPAASGGAPGGASRSSPSRTRSGAAGRTATSGRTCSSPRGPWTSRRSRELELYDMAALVPVVVEAGGRFTSLDGDDGPFGAGAVATNGLLHDAVLSVLAS